MRIHAHPNLGPDQQQAIRAVSPAIELVVGQDERNPSEAAEAEVFFGWISPEEFEVARQIKWVHVPAAGVDRWLFPALIESDVVMTGTQGAAAPALADHGFALLLAITRCLPQAFEMQQRQEWKWLPALELQGSTLGIVGFGRVGREVAQRAAGFGLRTLAVDLYPPKQPPEGVESVWPVDRLHDMLRQTDVLMMCAPYTPATDRMLGADEFALLREDAVFVNISRGKTVDEPALIAALKAGKPRAAGLDVVVEEPLPPDSPLWGMPNVTLTAHYATVSPQTKERSFDIFLDNLQRYVRGEPLINVVDKRAGF